MRVSWRLVLAAAGLATACQPAGGPPRLLVDHPTELVDAPLSIRVEGVQAGAAVTVRAHTAAPSWTAWSSTATFRAGTDGSVDLARAAPGPGSSYSGANATGLLWSLAPPPGATPVLPAAPPDAELVTLTASAGGAGSASRTVSRLTMARGVVERQLTVAGEGVYGRLYTPPAARVRRPAVLVFGGSEGGLTTTLEASLLASHGYPALALAYFAAPGLPLNLQSVPLEYFVRALTWLGQQPGVDPRRMVVQGASRGSEAALLLGVHFPELVHAVVAYAPSSVVGPGLAPGSIGGPALTLGGQPVPSVTPAELGDPSPAGDPQAIIPVEDIRGPVLLVSGADDQLWPSPRYAAAIMARLDAAHDPFVHRSLVYPGAGHAVATAVPNLPLVRATVDSRYGVLRLGGSPAANARALEDSWPQLLQFLATEGA